MSKDRAKEVSILSADLENEREARRGWQDKAVTFRQSLSKMVSDFFMNLIRSELNGD